MTAAPIVAAVLVTHDSQSYLSETLRSIHDQTLTADIRIVIDDLSSDGTPATLVEHGFEVHPATSTAQDTSTRIAQNFLQGLRAAVARGADVVILGDHDDVWHRTRIENQVAVLRDHPTTAFLASDGFLIDEHGAAVPGTIRTTFPIPENFDEQPLRVRLAYSLRHSIATGGASALRPSALTDWSVPSGWLHDRWWSLAALRADRFRTDSTPVIDYRLSDSQEVGLDTADQDDQGRWLLNKARRFGRTVSRTRDLSRLIRT